MQSFLKSSLVGVAVWGASAAWPAAASACGGFFCNAAQPVNQAAEGIIFADNGDGTTTAVIQIQYQGPSQSFSWLLPISSAPMSDSDIGIASNIALQRLQTATNPSYALTVKVEGTCRQPSESGGCGATETADDSSSPPRGAVEDAGPKGGVTVDASGVVGAFEWQVISLDPNLADPADTAVQWLTANGYDVPSGAPALLGPYLEAGMHLLALRLTKGADSGSIRPIVLTYQGSQPSIPIKLTAVAAQNDMGVLAWVLGGSRAVPANYLTLQLDEARIDWFNFPAGYNSLVTEAANDAGGLAFVTELAGSTSALAGRIWTATDDSNWSNLNGESALANATFFNLAYQQYGQWDGFWDATRAAVTLPGGQSVDALKACPSCYAVQFSGTDYLAALDKLVIQPVKLVQNLIDAHPEITRLYTTLSPDEMTLDPLFAFNPDAPEVSNVHTAERTVECNPSVYEYEAPWRVALPQGGTVWGTASNVGIWPSELSSLPPNRIITQMSDSGSGRVLEDDSEPISTQLASYNAGKSAQPSDGGGCATRRGKRSGGVLLALLALGAAVLRRRLRVSLARRG